jgi:hypothetical protein
MKRFLSMVFVGVFASSASALNLYMVALSGPNRYLGGVPSLPNGSVGPNALGGGTLPSYGGAGVADVISQTARMGIVIQLLDGTDGVYSNPDTPGGSNQLSTATVFFNQSVFGGSPESAGLAGIAFTARNDHGEEWGRFAYGEGMAHWVSNRTGGVGGNITPGASPLPYIEDYHVLASDRGADCPAGNLCGGNSFEGQHTFLLQSLVVHIAQFGPSSFVLFDTAMMTLLTETDKPYGFVNQSPTASSVHGGSPAAPGGFWYAVNGRTKGNAFHIESIIPEPASLALLGLAGLLTLRRRRRKGTLCG